MQLLDWRSVSGRELGSFRQFSDRYSWVIEHDTEGLCETPTREIPLDLVSFITYMSLYDSVIPYLKPQWMTLKSCVLRHKYIVVPHFGLRYWAPTIGIERDERWTLLVRAPQFGWHRVSTALTQLTKLDPAHRPPPTDVPENLVSRRR
jgi:hypothetical protein